MNNEIKWYYRERFNNKLRKTMVFSGLKWKFSTRARYNSFGEISDVKASNLNWKNWSLPLLDLISLFHHYVTSPRNPRYYRDL